MAWWWWVLIWVGLVLAAGTMFAFLLLSLWRKGVDLARELGAATERFALISEHLEVLAAQPVQPAVFDDQAELRKQRERALKLARARNALRLRQRSELRPAFPAKAQANASPPPSRHSVG